MKFKNLKLLIMTLFIAASIAGCNKNPGNIEYPIEIPFTEYSLDGTSCSWYYSGRLIIINSKQDMEKYLFCGMNDSYPDIDFSKYSLLLAKGNTENGIAGISKILSQQSSSMYMLDVEISLTSLTNATPTTWRIALLTDKIDEASEIELNVMFSYGKEFEVKEHYYYSFDEKIFLEQVKDKIFFKFAPNVNKEQVLALICSDVSLQIIPSFAVIEEEYVTKIAALESKDGSYIPLTTIEAFKAREEVISAEYIYASYSGGILGLNDRIAVRLKETTFYKQLQELAEQYHCTIEERSLFIENRFNLYLSKTSKLDAIQTANLFYETGLFVYAHPTFYYPANLWPLNP